MHPSSEAINWAENAEVFLGSIHVLEAKTAAEYVLNDNSQPVYLSEFKDADGDVISGQSDWLIAGNKQPAALFRFLYQPSTPNRLHFMITGSGPDHEKTVGVSRNGYLGLYKYASVSDAFKLEPLHWSEDAFICRWRDHLGHSVRTHHNPSVANPFFSYLRVREGKEVIFRIERAGS